VSDAAELRGEILEAARSASAEQASGRSRKPRPPPASSPPAP